MWLQNCCILSDSRHKINRTPHLTDKLLVLIFPASYFLHSSVFSKCVPGFPTRCYVPFWGSFWVVFRNCPKWNIAFIQSVLTFPLDKNCSLFPSVTWNLKTAASKNTSCQIFSWSGEDWLVCWHYMLEFLSFPFPSPAPTHPRLSLLCTFTVFHKGQPVCICGHLSPLPAAAWATAKLFLIEALAGWRLLVVPTLGSILSNMHTSRVFRKKQL